MQRLRTWWRTHRPDGPGAPGGEAFGLLLGVAVVAAIGCLALFLFRPWAPATEVTGTFLGLHAVEHYEGTRIAARARVDGREVLATTPGRILNCAPGDRIVLLRRQALVGQRYSAGPKACSR